MKNYKKRNMSDTVGTIGSMLLFLLFAGCLLMIIAVAAQTYSRLSTNFDKSFGSSASLRYISNKIKNANTAEIVEEDVLCLKYDDMMELVFFKNGALYEKCVGIDSEIVTEGGDKIFELSDMKVFDEGNLIKITVLLNGEENSTYVRR